MVPACPTISNSSSPFIKPLGIVLSTPITIGITVTFIFHSFFSFLARSEYFSLFLFSLIFTPWTARTTKSTIWQILVFFCCQSLDLVIWLELGDLFLSKIPRIDSGLCIYHLVVWSNFNFLLNSTQSCLVLYSFCTSLLHSFII